MNQSKEDNEKDFALALYYHIAEMIKAGKSHAEIEAALERQGVRRDTARQMLAKLEASRSNVTRRHGRRNIWLGGSIATAGVIMLVVLTQGNPTLGPQITGWLLFAGGIVWMLRGLLQASLK